jgi:hypothetical protein
MSPIPVAIIYGSCELHSVQSICDKTFRLNFDKEGAVWRANEEIWRIRLLISMGRQRDGKWVFFEIYDIRFEIQEVDQITFKERFVRDHSMFLDGREKPDEIVDTVPDISSDQRRGLIYHCHDHYCLELKRQCFRSSLLMFLRKDVDLLIRDEIRSSSV